MTAEYMEENPQVVVIAGPNGAGKTTLAPFLLRDRLNLREYVNADPIALGLSGFEPSSVAFKAGRVMMNRLRELAGQKKTFAFETTLAARSYAGWIKKLRREGYSFQLMFLWLRSSDLAVQRVRARARWGGHDVAEDIIRRRYRGGLINFWDFYRPLADTWAVYDNSVPSGPMLLATGGQREPLAVLEPTIWEHFRNA